MNNTAKKALSLKFAFLTAVAPLMMLSSPASAGIFRKSCKDAYLKVQNDTSQKIKVIDLDYWDEKDDKWRSEPVPNEVIPSGQPWQEIRNLEKVNKDDTKIRVKYRTLTNKGKWSWKVSKKESGTLVKCTQGQQYTITLR
ncbi:hypothetical protein C1752_01874 [Acaryochloris thomasi RCC1774]|uniref:Uncharacterized protein n=1 Tax=Acaryochloris thomasi RCC1774 TaxID=1764569 RepID=A0A2W1JKP8_9CYAN|nr:hypothetical protein [Acaryochloris thomasi]PZD73983.1 hypothetical protein C1752_01874 [Acaryochloris thomasi RCC1774]